jgi:IclR family acetate operon transcriptional repressor
MGDRRLVLRELPSSQEISFSLGEGSTMPILLGAAGRVLLSQYDDRTLKRFFSHLEIPPGTPDLMIDPDARMKEINEIRRRGYALNLGEKRPDVVGISATVTGYVCPVALCLFGPKFRYKPLVALDDILESAARISAILKSTITETGPIASTKNVKEER